MTAGETEPTAPAEAGGPPPDIKTVSVIVPHLDDYDNLDACLALLGEQTFPKDRTEIIIADNGSSRGPDALRELVGARGRIVEVEERGAGPARNAGVRASRGEALAFLDSDCRPDRRWLEEGLAGLRFSDFVGGRVDVLVGDKRRMTAAEAFESVFAFQNERYVKRRGFTVTASMFVPRSVFDAVGPFENGVPEDIDWCRRARAKGYRIGFAPRSIVEHPARRTMDELERKWRRLTLEWFTAARREGKGRAPMMAHEWGGLLAIAPGALALLTTRRLSGARDRILAIGVLARIRAYRFMVAHRAILGSAEK
ncbi:MAG TPA: glycosyltransferase [Roseiarcus sp.]|jgi:GT2 family glycosyltransferase|nr:glycosyltransferase [Roseiarcus sp.]